MQIYFHSRLCSYLPRVPILVEGTVNTNTVYILKIFTCIYIYLYIYLLYLILYIFLIYKHNFFLNIYACVCIYIYINIHSIHTYIM